MWFRKKKPTGTPVQRAESLLRTWWADPLRKLAPLADLQLRAEGEMYWPPTGKPEPWVLFGYTLADGQTGTALGLPEPFAMPGLDESQLTITDLRKMYLGYAVCSSVLVNPYNAKRQNPADTHPMRNALTESGLEVLELKSFLRMGKQVFCSFEVKRDEVRYFALGEASDWAIFPAHLPGMQRPFYSFMGAYFWPADEPE
jgi:hypothetical protein